MRKDALVTAAGIAGGQGVVVLATPFLARLYSPAEFGTYAVIVAAASIVATVSALRYDVAIPAVPEPEVLPLFQIAVALPVIICAFLAMAASAIPFDTISDRQISVQMMGLVASIAIFQGSVAVCQALLIRRGEFVHGALLRIVQPLGFVAIALLHFSSLSVAFVVAYALACVTALYIVRNELLSGNRELSFAAAKAAWRYPVISAPMALLDTLSVALPVIFIAEAYGDQAAGNYSQVQRLVAAPLLLLGMATGQVFFKHAGDIYRKGDAVVPLMIRVVGLLAATGIILVALAWAVGGELMKLLLGDGWRTDTGFIVIVLMPIVVRMVVSPVSSIFLISNRLDLGAAWQFGYFILTIGLLAVSYNYLGFDQFLIAYVLCELVSYVVYLCLSFLALRLSAA